MDLEKIIASETVSYLRQAAKLSKPEARVIRRVYSNGIPYEALPVEDQEFHDSAIDKLARTAKELEIPYKGKFIK